MGKFVSKDNLSYFWQKIKTLLSGKADKSEIPTNTVKYSSQTLTNAQKTQARTNIGAGSNDFNDLENKPVFRYETAQSFTLVNYDNIQEGVHILPYGASIYYGDSSSSTSTDYMVSTGAGSVVIFTKNSTGRTVYFKAFTNKEVITGATSSSSCVSRTIKFADGTSDLNKILKVTKATNNSSKIKTEATWVTPDVANNGILTIQKNGTNVATFGANSASNITANISVPTNTSELNNDSDFVTSSGSVANATKLNNQDASYYLNYNNLTNKPTIPSLADVLKTSGDQTATGVKTFSDGIKLGSATGRGTSTGSIDIEGDILNAPNLNDITQRGIYHCTKGTNTPTFDYANSEYDLMVFESVENGTALVTQMVNVGWKWWIRRGQGTTWGAWERFGQSFSGNYNDLTNKPTIPKLVTLTQSEYDALTTKDSNTYYFIKE